MLLDDPFAAQCPLWMPLSFLNTLFPHVFPSLQVGFQPGSGEHWLGSVLILALIHFAPRACWDPRDSFGTKEAASGHITPALKSCLASKCWDECWKKNNHVP